MIYHQIENINKELEIIKNKNKEPNINSGTEKYKRSEKAQKQI